MARSALPAALFLALIALGSSTPARKGKKQNAPGTENSSGPVTCPGYAGYCSESYPGDTCLVVCARGRNNVPECQEDGTWTDEPRCVEHEPGIQEQVPVVCPGIPGYCSLDLPGGLCTFECPVGPQIRSTCTLDGTWDPYPTCDGDPRETQDGCNPCPGPLGAPRNRTAEGGAAAGGRKSGGAAGGGSKSSGGGGAAAPSSGNRAAAGGQKSGGTAPPAAPASQPKANNRPATASNNKNNAGAAAQHAPASGRSQSGGSGSSGSGSSGNNGGCPGDVLQACIDVCPGFSTRVYGACVAGCAKRCPDKK